MIENEKYSIFQMETNSEIMFFKDTTSTDINDTMKRYVDCNGYYPEFVKNCERISEVEFAELEQKESYNLAFCAEINVDNDAIAVWNSQEFAAIGLNEAIQSIKENGAFQLNYQPFAANNEFDEIMSKLEDLSSHLANSYDDFLYKNSIFNNESIDFIDKHGDLPDDISSAENREIVSEYINDQLEHGSNLSDSQRETLTELKEHISEFDLEIQKISDWTDAAIAKADERQAEQERESQNNNVR